MDRWTTLLVSFRSDLWPAGQFMSLVESALSVWARSLRRMNAKALAEAFNIFEVPPDWRTRVIVAPFKERRGWFQSLRKRGR